MPLSPLQAINTQSSALQLASATSQTSFKSPNFFAMFFTNSPTHFPMYPNPNQWQSSYPSGSNPEGDESGDQRRRRPRGSANTYAQNISASGFPPGGVPQGYPTYGSQPGSSSIGGDMSGMSVYPTMNMNQAPMSSDEAWVTGQTDQEENISQEQANLRRHRLEIERKSRTKRTAAGNDLVVLVQTLQQEKPHIFGLVSRTDVRISGLADAADVAVSIIRDWVRIKSANPGA
ncbi:hypothetical protein SISSUDRAFT_1065960 [Sistotremastrum suecicum HHB10207 ss-3]|uniref:Uncharacterized protein n=1 Tax=Sistotremastrum suecicum HHB10207 ss-3 TaxID=1314776 RepID=A0A165YW73_9AGAM|nr:hypothetical protein SISSUDRAFT_1065960 [Sistotremastrum suecicum HHB10207 ss-3]